MPGAVRAVAMMQSDDAKALRRLRSLGAQLRNVFTANPTKSNAAGVVVPVPEPAAPQEEVFGPEKSPFSSAFQKEGSSSAAGGAPPIGGLGCQFYLKPKEWCGGPLSEVRLKELFGPEAWIEGPLARSGAGRRVHNVNLVEPLTPEQAAWVLDAFSEWGIISFPGQDLEKFSLAHFERFANHFGAPVPNYFQAMEVQKAKKIAEELFEKLAKEGNTDRKMANNQTNGGFTTTSLGEIIRKVDGAFPGRLAHLPTESPAVITVSNIPGGGATREDPQAPVKIGGGSTWHVDGEYDSKVPNSCSMFLVHHTPTLGDGKNWVDKWDRTDMTQLYLEDTDPELEKLRAQLPAKGETPFVDTAAAFEALPREEQAMLERIKVRRRTHEEDPGWWNPLVYTNPRNGKKGLHSPTFGNRVKIQKVPAVEIEGMTAEDTRALFDKLEKHCLQPQFRYDHAHTSGDVTIWSNIFTMHAVPPQKFGIDSIEDARLYYRLACKGPPALTLPRKDEPEWVQKIIPAGYTTPPELLNAGS